METNRQAWAIEPSTIGSNGAPFWYYIIGSENQIVATTWSGSDKQLEHARLIAAAPDLFYVVWAFVSWLKDSKEEITLMEVAEAAQEIIAKIEGGAE